MFSRTNLSGRIRNHEQNPIHTEQMARFARCYVHLITIGCNQTSAQLSNASGVLDSYLCLCLHCTDVVFRIVLSKYARSEDINNIHYWYSRHRCVVKGDVSWAWNDLWSVFFGTILIFRENLYSCLRLECGLCKGVLYGILTNRAI